MVKKNAENFIDRMEHCTTTTTTQAARNWYKGTIQVANNKMTQLNITDDTVANSNTGASNKAKDQTTERGNQEEATANAENRNEHRNKNA